MVEMPEFYKKNGEEHCPLRTVLESRLKWFFNILNCKLTLFFCVYPERHPIDYAIDGTNRWWQSPSIKNGMEYHYVTITLDLKQVHTNFRHSTCEDIYPNLKLILKICLLSFKHSLSGEVKGGWVFQSFPTMNDSCGWLGFMLFHKGFLMVTRHKWNPLWPAWIKPDRSLHSQQRGQLQTLFHLLRFICQHQKHE